MVHLQIRGAIDTKRKEKMKKLVKLVLDGIVRILAVLFVFMEIGLPLACYLYHWNSGIIVYPVCAALAFYSILFAFFWLWEWAHEENNNYVERTE